MTTREAIQAMSRDELERMLSQREDQLAKALEAEKLARAGFDKAAAERDQALEELAFARSRMVHWQNISDAADIANLKAELAEALKEAALWKEGCEHNAQTILNLKAMNNQDPQTAIDYNLCPSSARPSGLHVPQAEQQPANDEPTKEESFIAAVEGDYSGMSRQDLVLTCRMLFNGREIWRKEAEASASELAAFHAGIQRERKPDWEKWHMDLADIVDSISSTDEVASIKTPVSQLDVPGTLKTAARELRYMATSYTLKANFVPTDLEIKALKEQVESLEKQCLVMSEQLQSSRSILLHVYEWNYKHKTDTAFGDTVLAQIKQIENVTRTTAVRDYKSPEEVAAIVEKCQIATDSLHTQLTAHTQALRMADGVLRDCERRGSNLDLVAIRYCIDTITNLLK